MIKRDWKRNGGQERDRMLVFQDEWINARDIRNGVEDPIPNWAREAVR